MLVKEKKNIRLDSGDVAIWGGPQRMLKHNVGKVYQDTSPVTLPTSARNVRLNFTFRDAPNIIGREHEFASYTPSPQIREAVEEIRKYKEQQARGAQDMDIDKEKEKEKEVDVKRKRKDEMNTRSVEKKEKQEKVATRTGGNGNTNARGGKGSGNRGKLRNKRLV